MFTLFLYTGEGLDNFRANIPDNIIVVVDSAHDEARQKFIEEIGKEPELMGFVHTEGSSKEIAWQKMLDDDSIDVDIELQMLLKMEDALVFESTEENNSE